MLNTKQMSPAAGVVELWGSEKRDKKVKEGADWRHMQSVCRIQELSFILEYSQKV